MKILHAISSIDPAAGGPVVALLGLVRAQVAQGLDVHVISGQRTGARTRKNEFEAAGARITQIDATRGRGRFYFAAAAALRRAVEDADVVHTHGLWQFIPTLTAAAAFGLGRPYVVRPCGMLDSWSLAQNRRLKQAHLVLFTGPIIRRAALIHATTESERQEIQGHDFGPKVVVAPNGVDDVAFAPADAAAEARFEQLRRNHRLVLFLGRVRPTKGLDVLLPAMRAIRHRNSLLVIVGPASETQRAELDQQVQQLDLADRVCLLEPLYGPDRFAAYQAADVFVLPSEHENFGITVAEAMVSGVPVVLSPQVALSDMVIAEEAGLVVPRDPVRLAAAIDRLLENASERARLGENGRRVGSTRFRWSNIAKDWSERYAQLVAWRR